MLKLRLQIVIFACLWTEGSSLMGEAYDAWFGGSFVDGAWRWMSTVDAGVIPTLMNETFESWVTGSPSQNETGNYVYLSVNEDFKMSTFNASVTVPYYMCEAYDPPPPDQSCSVGGRLIWDFPSCHLLRKSIPALTWSEALAQCQGIGPNVTLAGVETQQEFNALRGWLRSIVPPPTTTVPAAPSSTSQLNTTTLQPIMTSSHDVTTTDMRCTTSASCPPAPPCDCTLTTKEQTTMYTTQRGPPTSADYKEKTTTGLQEKMSTKNDDVIIIEDVTPTVPQKSLVEAASEEVIEPMTFDHLPDPKYEPVAMGIGVTGMVVVTSFLGMIVVLDLASLKKDVKILMRNIRSVCNKRKPKRGAVGFQ